MNHRRAALSATFGLGLAASLGLGAVPASAATASDAHAAPAASSHTAHAGYIGKQKKTDASDSKALFNVIVKDALKKQAVKPGLQAVTVNYDPSGAATYKSQIDNAAKVWNGAVKNVKLAEGGNASFEYREGDDSRGSYAQTDGHGGGYVFIDHKQAKEYDANRVVAHETGHVLGLPDNYEGPCSELMSGGGPGPSCKNDKPNADESAKVDQQWSGGVAKAAFDAAAVNKSH